jgi:hypothetical protein
MANEEHRAQRRREKHNAVEHIQNALALIEPLGREPDDWEKVHLAKAIGSLSNEHFGAAVTHAQRVLTPVHQRWGHITTTHCQTKSTWLHSKMR